MRDAYRNIYGENSIGQSSESMQEVVGATFGLHMVYVMMSKDSESETALGAGHGCGKDTCSQELSGFIYSKQSTTSAELYARCMDAVSMRDKEHLTVNMDRIRTKVAIVP